MHTLERSPRNGTPTKTLRKETKLKMDNFIEKVKSNDPSINPNNPLENNDNLADFAGFWNEFMDALGQNQVITKLIWPTNKTIVQRKSTIEAFTKALKMHNSIGNVSTLKLISMIGSQDIVDALKFHQNTFRSVSIKWNPLSVGVAQKWADYIRTNTVLTTFTFNVGREGSDTDTCGMLLAEALEWNSSITTLKLRSNDFGEKFGLQFTRVLEKNTTLTHVDLSYNRMGIAGFEAVFKALTSTKTVATLILKDCDINEESVKYLANSLKHNTSLTKLVLFANSLRAGGAVHLSDSLKSNSTLQYLDLYGNNLHSEGADEIAKMLKLNRGLSHLSLQSNAISHVGIQKIAESLQHNCHLTCLNLANNSIGQSEASLCKMLCVNSTLTKLDLRFTNAKRHSLEEALKTRRQPLEIVWLY